MTEPSGKIVARPMVTRSCGHQQEFQHYEVDKYRPQRLAKFQKTRCADCVAKLNEEQRRATPLAEGGGDQAPPPGNAGDSDPAAGRVLGRQADVGGTQVEAAGVVGAGPQAVVARWPSSGSQNQQPAGSTSEP